jgi:hypothetical protein
VLVEYPGKMAISDAEIVIGGYTYLKDEEVVTKSNFAGDIFEPVLFKELLGQETIDEIFWSTAPFERFNVNIDEVLVVNSGFSHSSKESVTLSEKMAFGTKAEFKVKRPIVLDGQIIDLLELVSENRPVKFSPDNTFRANDEWGDAIEDMSISAWIKPEFNANPAYSILSKDNAFNLKILNTASQQRTLEFSLYDGITWHVFSSTSIIQEHWNHVLVTVSENKVTRGNSLYRGERYYSPI